VSAYDDLMLSVIADKQAKAADLVALEGQARDLVVAAIGLAGDVATAAELLHELIDHVIAPAPAAPEPPVSAPDADGLVRIAALAAFGRELRAQGHGALADLMVPERCACQSGLEQLEQGSNLWHIVRTEMAWAALNDSNQPFGNPLEILHVNRYVIDDTPGLPLWRRLIRQPFDYVPRALAFGPKHATPADVVAEVKRRVRYSLSHDGKGAPGVDFSPLPPLP
jgi:hypothetical protein